MYLPDFFDCHTHSHHSPDGKETVRDLVQNAIQKSLHGILVTDHCEANAYHQDGYDRRIADSAQEVWAEKEKLHGQLVLGFGIELGQPLQDIACAEEAVRAHEYDVILCSVHNLNKGEDFYFLNYAQEDPYVLLQKYFEEVYQSAEWGQFDVLAHLTYPLRYMKGREKLPITLEPFYEQIDAILHSLIRQGKALEINTSGLRQNLGETMPGLSVLKRFHELGGKYVTLGSDAHRKEDLGAQFLEGLQLLREAGFNQVTYYQKRSPIQVDIG